MPSHWDRAGSVIATGCLTVAAAVAEIAARWPGNGFTFQDPDGRETTYPFPQIEAASAARAVHLKRLGLRKGDRLALAIRSPKISCSPSSQPSASG